MTSNPANGSINVAPTQAKPKPMLKQVKVITNIKTRPDFQLIDWLGLIRMR